ERRRNAAKFLALMGDYPYLRVQKEIGESSWSGFSMIIEDGAPFARSALVRALTDHKIDVRPIVAGNFAKNEVLQWFQYETHGSLKNAEALDTKGLFVGNHHYPLDQEFELLRQALDEVIA